MVTKLQCRKCNWEWLQRSERKPKVCPKCKSYNWETKTNENESRDTKMLE